MEEFVSALGVGVLRNCIAVIRENKEYLSEVDGATGDGDHGVNMSKGFTICEARLADTMDFSVALKTLGRTLLADIGGSMGPLYGTFFLEMAKACAGKTQIGRDLLGGMLLAGLEGIRRIGGAQPGDKTLLDVLVPAVDAYQAARDDGKSFREALMDMKTASRRGMEATGDMVAKVGRASRLGERSRGHLDAGAVSCHLLLTAMADGIVSIL